MIKVLVLIDYSAEFSRLLISGLIRYAQESGPWSFYRLPLYYKSIYGEEGVIEWIKEWKADFIIVQWNYIRIESLKKLAIPVFLQDYQEEGKFFSNITGDYIGMGTMAARFFIQRRYKNFAFYGSKGFIWSSERAEGFRREIEKIKGNYFYFENEGLNELEWMNNHVQLENWLQSLPKPVAIFACDDTFAIQISDLCRLSNIKIPDDVALLGVDNDNLICNLSDPPISSIVLDAENGGVELGRKIREIVTNKNTTKFNISINPLRIELRKSTEKYNIEDKYVGKVVKFIQENYHMQIQIDMLTQMVPLSRRNLEIRFRKAMGISIYQFVLNVRIEHFTLLLITTDLPLLDILVQSGFNDYTNVFRIFKKINGCTPLAYRQQFFRTLTPKNDYRRMES